MVKLGTSVLVFFAVFGLIESLDLKHLSERAVNAAKRASIHRREWHNRERTKATITEQKEQKWTQHADKRSSLLPRLGPGDEEESSHQKRKSPKLERIFERMSLKSLQKTDDKRFSLADEKEKRHKSENRVQKSHLSHTSGRISNQKDLKRGDSSITSGVTGEDPCEGGMTITCDRGTIMSPGYPQGYYGNDNCTWNIVAEQGKIIEIDFVDFSLPDGDCQSGDHVAIYDVGSGLGEVPPETFCGTEGLPKFNSVGNEVRVEFDSNADSSDKGFLFNYRMRDAIPCEDTIELVGSSGELTSANYPRQYEPYSNCQWRIVTPPNTTISLEFDDIALEQARSCEWDGVRLFDGDSKDAPSLGIFCGRDHSRNHNITSTGHVVLVNLVSDGSTEDRGFSLKWTVIGGDQSEDHEI